MPPLFFCLILIVLNTLDAIITIYGLSIGLGELNQIFPPAGNLNIKIALPFLYLAFFFITSKLCKLQDLRIGLKILKINVSCLIALYSAILVNNLICIFRGLFA